MAVPSQRRRGLCNIVVCDRGYWGWEIADEGNPTVTFCEESKRQQGGVECLCRVVEDPIRFR